MPCLDGRVAIVTGSAGALGQAVAAHFTDLGATVIGIVRPGGTAAPAGLDTRACDLADEDSVAEHFDAIANTHGRIDILANIAGGFAMGQRIEDTTPADWTAMLRINAVSAYLASKYALPPMREAGFGRIINIGARAVRRPAARMGPYCVSKAAVVTLTEVLAAECVGTDMTCNCILPGTIDTPRNRADMPQADFSNWIAPADLAHVAGQLADPANRATNGAMIPVYGAS